MTAVYQQQYITVDFSTSSFYSDPIRILGQTISYIQVPDTWGSTYITFQGSVDGSTFANVYAPRSGGDVVLTINSTTGKFIETDQIIFSGINYLQLTSGKVGSEVLQTSPQTIGIGLGRYKTDTSGSVSQNSQFDFGGRRGTW